MVEEKISSWKQLFNIMQQEINNVQEWNDSDQLFFLFDQNIKNTLLYLCEATLKENEDDKKIWTENLLGIYNLLSDESPRDSLLDHYLYHIKAFLTPRLFKKNWRIVKEFIPKQYRDPFLIQDQDLSKLLIVHVLKNYWQDSCFSFMAIILHLNLQNSLENPWKSIKKLLKYLNEEGFNSYISYFIRQNTGNEIKNNFVLKLQDFLEQYELNISATDMELFQASIYIALMTSEPEEFLADSWWKKTLFRNYYNIYIPRKSGQLIQATNLAIQNLERINYDKFKSIYNIIQDKEEKQYIDKINNVRDYFGQFKTEIEKYMSNSV